MKELNRFCVVIQILLTVTLLVAVFTLSGCSGGGEDDNESSSNSSTAVTNSNNDSCPVDIDAASPEEAIDAAENETGGEAVAVEEMTNNGGLDQSTALRTFRVYLKNIQINVNGCGNETNVTVNDNDSDDDTTTSASVTVEDDE